MKIRIACTFFILCVSATAHAAFIDTVRTDFYRAVGSEEQTDKLRTIITAAYPDPNTRPPLYDSYIGALDTLKGKFAYNPYAKYRFIKEGLSRISRSVKAEPDNLEIRFIRFSVLHHLPSLFSVEKSRSDDAAAICAIFAQGRTQKYPHQLLQGVIEFMLASGRLDDTQKLTLTEAKF